MKCTGRCFVFRPDNHAMKTIRLKEGKERSLLRRHPWIFDGAIARGGADAGETVRVESDAGQFLAWAAFSPSSKIRARVWSFDEVQRIDASFFIARIAESIKARNRFDIKSDGFRLIHGESDGLPGLVVDRYADTLVAQFSSCGSERWKSEIVDLLCDGDGRGGAAHGRHYRCSVGRAGRAGAAPAGR